MDYSLLDALNSDKDKWMIKVRVCRMWESTNSKKNNELISIDMILIDEKENLIHVIIRKHLAPRFRHLLKEGSLYSIKNLKVVANTDMYRSLSCKFKALFLANTSIKNLEECIVSIPLHGFQFVTPDTIDLRVNDTNILSDVVGCLCRVGNIDVVGANLKKRDLKIITSHSLTTTITLWGKLGELFDPSLYVEDGGPYVIIVTSTTIKQFKGEISFNSTSASKIYVNLDTPYVASLRERFGHVSNKLEVTETTYVKKLQPEEEMFLNRMSVMGVRELLKADWNDDVKDYVATVRGKIIEIDNTFGWYYIACKICQKKLLNQDGVYVCNTCHKPIDYPLVLFKIQINVEDQTGQATFVLFNNVAERLLDTSAKKLFNKASSSESDVPKEIQILLERDLIFKLRLNHYNLRDGFENFTISEVFEPNKKLEDDYESKNLKKDTAVLEDSDQEASAVRNKKRGKSVVVDDEDDIEADTGKKKRSLVMDDEDSD